MEPYEARALALSLACRAVPQGDPTGHFLSTARLFEQYLLSGLTQVGPQFRQGFGLGEEGWYLRIEGPALSPEEAHEIRDALTDIIRRFHD